MQRDEDRRATWLETRNLEENFKQLVYLSMQEVECSLQMAEYIRERQNDNSYMNVSTVL